MNGRDLLLILAVGIGFTTGFLFLTGQESPAPVAHSVYATLEAEIPTLRPITATTVVHIPQQTIQLPKEQTIVLVRPTDGATVLVTNQGGQALIRINCGSNKPTVSGGGWGDNSATYGIDAERHLIVDASSGMVTLRLTGMPAQEELTWQVDWGPGPIKERPVVCRN